MNQEKYALGAHQNLVSFNVPPTKNAPKGYFVINAKGSNIWRIGTL